MSRNPTPQAVLDAKGAFIHNPQLRRPDEAKSARPIGAPPKWLTDAERVVWKDLVKQVCPGVLTFADRDAFEVLCVLTARFRERKMSVREMPTMLVLLGHFGMTPASRTKITATPVKESKLAKFLGKPQPTAPRPAPPARPALPAPFDPAAPVN